MSTTRLEVHGVRAFIERLKAGAGRLFWVGLALIAIGVLAIVFPAVSATVTIVAIGWLFILAGVVLLFGGMQLHGAGPFFGAFLFALLTFAAGVWLIANPAAGMVALTILLAILFLVNGAAEMVLALELRPEYGWRWMLVSALVSILLGIVLAAGLPGTAAFFIGLIVGLNFLTSGFAFVLVSRALKRALKETGESPQPGL
jgi:uncharacterized membrane protein HdeD (DUF308 family)